MPRLSPTWGGISPRAALRLVDIGFALERLANHRFPFAAAVPELQQHGQRFVGKIGNRDRLGLRRVLDEQELRHFALEFRDDVARLLLSDAGQRLEKGVVAAIDRRGDRRHRLRERPRCRARTDRRDGQQRLEELALDGVGESVVRETAAVAVHIAGRRRSPSDALARALRHLVGDAGRQNDFVAETRGLDDRRVAGSLDQRAGDAANTTGTQRASDHVEEGERERQCVGDVVGFWGALQSQQLRDHGVDLRLAGAARTDERAFDVRVAERVHRDAGLRAGQAEDAARVPHQHRRARILIARVELLDDDPAGFDLRDDVGDAGVQLAQPLFERTAHLRRDDAGFDQIQRTVAKFDRAVTGRSQRRIDTEDSKGACFAQGGGVPLTVIVTDEPGASVVPAGGVVPTTLPSAPTLVVYSRLETW